MLCLPQSDRNAGGVSVAAVAWERIESFAVVRLMLARLSMDLVLIS